jgi:hypothetical protein
MAKIACPASIANLQQYQALGYWYKQLPEYLSFSSGHLKPSPAV